MSMFTRNRNRQSLSQLRDKLPKRSEGQKEIYKQPWFTLTPVEKYERRRGEYERMMKRKNKVMEEMKKQREIRKKRQEYIKSIDPNKGIKI